MDQEEKYKFAASQLRKPEGEEGKQMGERMNQANVHINRHTIEALQLPENASVLEIGMGNGFFVPEILGRYPSVTYYGCDFSSDMVSESIQMNKELVLQGKAEFVLGSADKLPYPNLFFDKVFTINTLYFWEDQKAVLEDIRRVLKPGGELLISIRPEHIMKFYPFSKYGFNLFSKEEVKILLEENNFKVIDILEKKEPDHEIGGQKVAVETLIVKGRLES